MTDICDYNTNTSLCSNLATMVLKIVHYMNVVSSRHMDMQLKYDLCMAEVICCNS